MLDLFFLLFADDWTPGSGLVGMLSALIAGGIGGGGAVALVMTYLGLRHLKEKDDALHRLVIDTVATNTALLVELKAMLQILMQGDQNKPMPPEGQDRGRPYA